jgi:hypothetical protein
MEAAVNELERNAAAYAESPRGIFDKMHGTGSAVDTAKLDALIAAKEQEIRTLRRRQQEENPVWCTRRR